MNESFARRLTAEFIGTAMLVATVIGSGIMAEHLSGGNMAIALLANTLATGAMLVALIVTLGPVSGAHMNPAVTIASAVLREHPWRDVPGYAIAQISGGLLGTALANMMFDLPAFFASQHPRTGPSQWLAETIATFGLMGLIIGSSRRRPSATPYVVACYITAAYWFTASTSFANPAVTIARTLSDTFAGIRPADAPAFIAVQLVGALAATLVFGWLVSKPTRQPST